MAKIHKPVLLKETLDFLHIKKGKKYIDATLGGAGHAEAILKKGGHLLGLDCDPEALAFSRKRLVSACPPSAFSWRLTQGNFAHLKSIASQFGFSQVAGILFDLGVSTLQLESPDKGFSFGQDSPLDMRLDPSLGITAADLINHLSPKELKKLFQEFGQEPYALKIAQVICEERPIKSTRELAQIISQVRPRGRKKIHPATQVFQALRIAVNSELENLQEALPQAADLLKKDGRLVVISFHSLEDKIVKNFFKNQKKLIILTKKPVRPSPSEVRQNPRSRSARLRAAQKQ